MVATLRTRTLDSRRMVRTITPARLATSGECSTSESGVSAPMTRPPSAPTAIRLSVAILRRLTRRRRLEHAGLHHQHQRGAAAERAYRSVVGIEERQRLLQRRRLGQLERGHGPAPGAPAAKRARIFSTKPFSISFALDLSTG